MLDPISFQQQLTGAEVTFVQGIADHTYTDGQLIIGNGSTGGVSVAALTAGSGVTITNGQGTITIAATSGGGTVTSVSVVSANGFAGTVATATTTPAITLTTTITGIIKGNGTALSAATDGTDYLSSSTGVLLSNVTTTATASKIVERDANANSFANNTIDGYTTTATAGTTTTLTVGSTYHQFFTGSSNQTVQLPDATTLSLGFQFRIHNNSTGAITIQDAGLSTVWIVAAGTQGVVTCTNIGTAAGTWDTEYLGVVAGTGKKVGINNSLTLQGTDNTTFTFPSSTDTVVTLAATQTLTNKTLTSPVISTIVNTGTLTLPTSTDTLVGKATTDIFTNKTYDTAGTGNVFKINGTQITAVTGSGSAVLATSPTLVTPTLGVATATSINKVAITAPTTSATLTIADGKTFTVSNTLTFTGTDTSSVAFGAGGTVAYTANNLSVFAATTSAQLAGVISDETGSGSLVFATSPTITTPTINQINASASTSIKINAGSYPVYTSDTDGVTVTFDLSVSNTHTVTLGGNRTLALSNVSTGQCFMINLKQDATGSRTVTWFLGISWPGGTVPILTTTASKTDTFGFQCTGTGAYLGYIIGQNL